MRTIRNNTVSIHVSLQDDAAYQYSVGAKDPFNMALTLRAYGFGYDLESCYEQIDYATNMYPSNQ